MGANAGDSGNQAIGGFDRRSATLILWTGLAGMLVVVVFSYRNWSYLTTASVLWAIAAVSLVPISATLALVFPSRRVRSIALVIAWLGWFILVVVGLLAVVAWVTMCPADVTLCGQGTIRR